MLYPSIMYLCVPSLKKAEIPIVFIYDGDTVVGFAS